MSEHALLSASAAPQWFYCSGSVRARNAAPDNETQEAREGTAAHWVAAECLLTWRDTARSALCADWAGQVAPNGVVIDDEMCEAAQMYVDDVLKTCQKHGSLKAMLIEQRVNMPNIHAENWGTADLILPVMSEGVVYVYDFKYGRVEVAPDSPQLVDYAAGLYELLGLNGESDQQLRVVLKIVQPRCYSSAGPIRGWTGMLSDLRGQFNQLTTKANEAMTAPTFSAGAHCRNCPIVGTCSTARRAGYSAIAHVNEECQIDSMSDADLAVERGILQASLTLVKERLEAIEELLIQRLSEGSTGSGLALENKPGRVVFSLPPEQVVSIFGQFGVDVVKPATLTPAQALKATPKELRDQVEQVLKSITTRNAGSLKLIKAAGTVASQVFSRR